jgi:hypothetical protein
MIYIAIDPGLTGAIATGIIRRYRGRDARYRAPPRTDPGGRDSRTGLPPRVSDGKAGTRPGMKDARWRKIRRHQPGDPLPGRPDFLAASPKRPMPEDGHVVAKRSEAPDVGGHGVVREIAADHLGQPPPLLLNRRMHPPTQFALRAFSLLCIRSRRVFHLSWKYPARERPQMCVKPRKLNVAGLPRPRFPSHGAPRP